MYCGEHREHGKPDYRQEYRLNFTLSDVEFDDAHFYPVVYTCYRNHSTGMRAMHNAMQ